MMNNPYGDDTNSKFCLRRENGSFPWGTMGKVISFAVSTLEGETQGRDPE